jgi:hypothetical protein
VDEGVRRSAQGNPATAAVDSNSTTLAQTPMDNQRRVSTEPISRKTDPDEVAKPTDQMAKALPEGGGVTDGSPCTPDTDAKV